MEEVCEPLPPALCCGLIADDTLLKDLFNGYIITLFARVAAFCYDNLRFLNSSGEWLLFQRTLSNQTEGEALIAQWITEEGGYYEFILLSPSAIRRNKMLKAFYPRTCSLKSLFRERGVTGWLLLRCNLQTLARCSCTQLHMCTSVSIKLLYIDKYRCARGICSESCMVIALSGVSSSPVSRVETLVFMRCWVFKALKWKWICYKT